MEEQNPKLLLARTLLIKFIICVIQYTLTISLFFVGSSSSGSRFKGYWHRKSQENNQRIKVLYKYCAIFHSIKKIRSQNRVIPYRYLQPNASDMHRSTSVDNIITINEQRKHILKLDRVYFTLLTMFPEKYITEKCICKAKESCTYRKLEGTEMKECHCLSHHRFKPNNIRVKTENVIIQHILKHLMGQPVRILSLGPGAYLQDLMIILRLAEAGIKSIHITFVEPHPCLKAFQEFKTFLEKITVAYDLYFITYCDFTDISEVSDKKEYDVIYAIDYKECNSTEYLREHLHDEEHDNETLTSHPDKAAWDLITASKLLTSKEHGLVIVSKCKEILHKTSQSFPSFVII